MVEIADIYNDDIMLSNEFSSVLTHWLDLEAVSIEAVKIKFISVLLRSTHVLKKL